MNDSTTKLLEDLKSPDPKIRHAAIRELSQFFGEGEYEVWQAVMNLAETDPDDQVVGAAGIAASMITARNSPHSIMYNSYVPNFLRPYNEPQGIPSEHDWDLLDQMKGDIGNE